MKPFSFSNIDIGLTAQPVYPNSFPRVVRFTVKCRSLGSNTYISLGDFSVREFRLTAIGDSLTFVDIPPEGVDLNALWASGDGAGNDGIIEVVGLQTEVY